MSDHFVWRVLFFLWCQWLISRLILFFARFQVNPTAAPPELRGSRVEPQKSFSKLRRTLRVPSYHLMAPCCAISPNGTTGTSTKYQVFIYFVQQEILRCDWFFQSQRWCSSLPHGQVPIKLAHGSGIPALNQTIKTEECPCGSASGRNDNSIEFRRIHHFFIGGVPRSNIRIFI